MSELDYIQNFKSPFYSWI